MGLEPVPGYTERSRTGCVVADQPDPAVRNIGLPGSNLLIATWNLNNRVGKVRFRPEAADAATALGADILVFTEYYPQAHHEAFCATLAAKGWTHQLISGDTGEIANRVLIVSRVAIERLPLAVPSFDRHLPSNVLAVGVPSAGLSLIGVRIPAYESRDQDKLAKSWEWLAALAQDLARRPALILGDLNVSLDTPPRRMGGLFRDILEKGWHRAEPAGGASFFGHGGRQSEIDHMLGTQSCIFADAALVTKVGGIDLARAPGAISDHAALIARVSIVTPP